MIAILRGCVLVGGMLAALAVAQAQNYPERPIRLVVAFVAGGATVAHLTFEVFKDGAGMEAVHIPYKGGGQAIGDIIAGQVEMHMASVAVAKPLVEAGRIKALAVTGAKRSPALPNVPTLAE